MGPPGPHSPLAMNRDQDKVGTQYYVYTPVDGDAQDVASLEEGKVLARQKAHTLDDCGCVTDDTAAHVVDRSTGEWVWTCAKGNKNF